MRGTKLRNPSTTPITLIPNVHFQSSSVASQIGPAVPTPALLKSRWHAPKRSYTDFARCSTLSAFETSLRNVRDCASGLRSAIVVASPPSSTSVRTTFIPSSAQRIANSRPNPLAAPVMTATFSRSSFIPVSTVWPPYNAAFAAAGFALISLYNSFLDSLPTGVPRQRRPDLHLRYHIVFSEAALEEILQFLERQFRSAGLQR